jgi:hypothetical protein
MSTIQGGQGNIITNGLVLNLDAANPRSYDYPYNGLTWRDLSGNGNNGTLVNGVGYSSSNGGSLVFDGTNDYVNLGNTINFSNYTNGFTISFWVKLNSLGQLQRYLFSKRNTGGADNQFSVIYGYVSNTYELYAATQASGGANQNIRTNSQIVVNDLNWHNLTYVVGTTTIGYLDGVVRFTNTYPSLTFVSSTNMNTICSFNISQNLLNSNVSSVRLYNYTFSTSEVLQNYNATRARFGV